MTLPTAESKRIAILGWINSVHVQRWAEGLAARGFEIKVISLGGEPRKGINATIIPRSGRASYLTKAGQAARAVEAFRPHLVHAHYAAGFGWWMLRCKTRPRVVSVWGADVIDFPNNWLKRMLIREVLTAADHITATSQLLKQVATKLAPAISNRISVIPFGVRVPVRIAPVPSPAPFRVCFIKAHSRKYGPVILLEALAKVKQTVPDIQLSLAGEGELTSELRKSAVDLGLENNVNFIGFIDNKKIYDLIGEHHLMVMPSVMESESFGVAVLEAGACGRAVVASEVGGVPEVLVDGRTGLLVPPGDVNRLADAIVKLATDFDLCQKMGQEGYKFVSETYDWENSLDAMAELYRRLIHEKN
ncbi:MAG: glycosyltransferase family 4 protein [candidate division Zixibacteria bacterium]|nr:glycosyltransferase family 4 protein [candidate division Zixibacteria bacterium]